MGARKKSKPWTASGAARMARDARISTVRFLRDAPLARDWQGSKMLAAFQLKETHLRNQVDAATARSVAATLLFTGMGYPETWRPENWVTAAETIVADQARSLTDADLYIVSPQMCDVVVAAAQTLTLDDLSLITEEDLPSRSGLLVLPHPLLVRAINGELGDERAYQWHSPIQLDHPDGSTGRIARVPGVRLALYHDSHGPVRPDSFLEFADAARAQGTPLPPLLLDALRAFPFGMTMTEEQRRNLTDFAEVAQQVGERTREHNLDKGVEEDRVIGEYTPGSEITDSDDSFMLRFLYAFWRLCEQRLVTTEPTETRHAARVASEKAGVSPEVRVVKLRTGSSGTENTADGDTGHHWRHRWVVRMHKVRQWYPSEQRHKVLYRGPYVKGPADKPLLDGDVVRGLTR